jgi:hypothetical protein
LPSQVNKMVSDQQPWLPHPLTGLLLIFVIPAGRFSGRHGKQGTGHLAGILAEDVAYFVDEFLVFQIRSFDLCQLLQ